MKIFSNDIFFAQVESEIAAGRSVRFKVKGHSMYPLLRNGKDEVTLSPLEKVPAVNDIVLFRYHGKHILHRIISIEGDTYTIEEIDGEKHEHGGDDAECVTGQVHAAERLLEYGNACYGYE